MKKETYILPSALYQARISSSMSAKEASKESGLSKTYILSLESGLRTNPTLSVLQTLASTYNVRITLEIDGKGMGVRLGKKETEG